MTLALAAFVVSPGVLNAANLPTDFQDEVVAEPFQRCVAFDFLPDGRILVIEQRSGNVRLVVNETLVGSPIYTFPDVNLNGGERGLLGIAVDPEFPGRPYVYFHYDHAPGDSIFVARYTATGDLSDGSSSNLSLQDRFLILDDLTDQGPYHNGGTLRFGPDGMLFISLGDDGGSGACAAQDTSAYNGKIFRVDVSAIDGTTPEPPPKPLITPPDNPFPPTDPIAGIVFCLGLRNPFRFTIDSYTGRLFVADVGNAEYEELDVASGGENFGWPFREGPIVQDFQAFPCDEPGGSGTQSYVEPIAFYSHQGQGSLSVIAGPCYRPVPGATGNFPLLYNGAVFYSDFYVGFIRVLKEQSGTWAPLDSVPGQPSAGDWATGLSSPSHFQVGPDGSIYYTSLNPGRLRRIRYTGSPVTGVPDDVSRPVVLRAVPNPLRAGQRLTLSLPDGEPIHQVTIFDSSGRRVRSLSGISGSTWTWDGRDEGGRSVPAGVYFVQTRGPHGAAAARIVVVP